MSGTFTIRIDPEPCCDLEGRPLEEGEPLELQLEDSTWLRGRFHWTGERGASPELLVSLGGGKKLAATVHLPEGARLRRASRSSSLRWPKGESSGAICGPEDEPV